MINSALPIKLSVLSPVSSSSNLTIWFAILSEDKVPSFKYPNEKKSATIGSVISAASTELKLEKNSKIIVTVPLIEKISFPVKSAKLIFPCMREVPGKVAVFVPSVIDIVTKVVRMLFEIDLTS